MRTVGEGNWWEQAPIVVGLPSRLTSILGRAGVIEEIDTLLGETAVVTIVGPGGIGKSTVALAAAARHARRTTRATRLLDLAHCRDDSDVLPYVFGALDIPQARGAGAGAIAEALAGRQSLLVLDNCERVIEAVADLAGQVARTAPQTRLVATSRESLRVPGERVVRLAGLESPPPDRGLSAAEARTFPALGLLCERATEVDARFALTDADVEPAIRLCGRLDGIPLAIELAAARLNIMGMRALAERLEAGLDVLSDGRRTAMPHHRTLEATLDWSFTSLSELERTVLLSLSVFCGSYSLASALAIATAEGQTTGQVARCVGDLVAKSLIAVQPGHERRYRLLETTRQYGRDRLARSPLVRAVRHRHATECLELLDGARDDLLRVRRDLWMQRYGALVADVRDAIDWAFSAEGDRDLGTSLVFGAAPLGEQQVLPRDYFDRLEDIVARAADGEPEIARFGLALAHARIQLNGDLRSGLATVQRMGGAVSPADQRPPEVLAAEFGAALLSGEYPDALTLAAEIQRLGKLQGDSGLSALGNRCAAQANYHLGHFDAAEEQAQQVLASPLEYLPHSMNNHRITMRVTLATCAAMRGELDVATDIIETALRMGRTDNPLTLCVALVLGAVPVALWSGDTPRADRWLAEARDVAGSRGAAFWTLSVGQLGRAVDVVSGRGRPEPSDPDPDLEARIGCSVLDALPTFSPDLFSPRTLERVRQGKVGWNAAEVERVAILRDASNDPERALQHLKEADLRPTCGLWQRRRDQTLAQLASHPEAVLSLRSD
jgi:predicted ATPase